MTPTNKYNQVIRDFLNKMGVKLHSYTGKNSEFWDVVLIDRTSMVQTTPVYQYEEDAYQYWMNEIKAILPPICHVTWGSRTDDWLGIEVWERKE